MIGSACIPHAVIEDSHLIHNATIYRKHASPMIARFPSRHVASFSPCQPTLRLPSAAVAAERGEIEPEWDKMTSKLVALSTVPFLLLFLPQILKNGANIAAGNPAALGSLSYISFVTGLAGNTLLLSYFTSKEEMSAVAVQAIGIASSFIILTQMRMTELIPHQLYAAIAIAVASSAIFTALKLNRYLDSLGKFGQLVWIYWQRALGLAGLGIIPQALSTTLFGSTSLTPGGVALSLGCLLVSLEAFDKMPKVVANLWPSLSAWTATILFMLQPIAQLILNFSDPSSLHGLSLATILLASMGNGLMMPRALATNDVIWSVGTIWGYLVFGWAQLLSLYLGRKNAITGERFISLELFLVLSVIIWMWMLFVLLKSRKIQKYCRTE